MPDREDVAQSAGQASVSSQVIDRIFPHSSIDDASTELKATRDGRFLCGVGPKAAEGPQVPVAADQEVEGPAPGATYLKSARRDGEALIGDRIQPDRVLLNHAEIYQGGLPYRPEAERDVNVFRGANPATLDSVLTVPA